MATKKSAPTVRAERSVRAAAPEPSGQLTDLLAKLSAQVEALSERLAKLEAASSSALGQAQGERTSETPPVAPAAAPAAKGARPRPTPPPTAPEISEEELLAVSAALAAFFGVRMRIRQIRLLGSQAWAQQGRVSIQASHRLNN